MFNDRNLLFYRKVAMGSAVFIIIIIYTFNITSRVKSWTKNITQNYHIRCFSIET